MIRKIFKKKHKNRKIEQFIKKYKIPREYLSINRKSITRGIFIGLFWGFIPMPMQMLAVISMTPFLKFNVPLAISMVWLSNPITMPFMYYMEYQTGNLILGRDGLENIELTIDWFSNNWDNIIVPLYVGTIPYSVFVSAIVCFLIDNLWIASVKKERPNRFRKDKVKSKKAFTLIEIIMSVIIVSIVVMGAMKLQDKNRDMAVYISQRGNSELDNSLFLTQQVYRYDKDEKDAYELLRQEFEIKDDKSKEVLKAILKNINITEDKEIPISLEKNSEPIFTFYTNEILLKGKYPARYYNFR